MKTELNINTGQVKLSIELCGYENTSALTEDDANWISAHVSVAVMRFSASIDCSFRPQDFVNFLNSLNACFDGKASVAHFETMEEGLLIQLEFQKNRSRFHCTIKESRGEMPSLTFKSDLNGEELMSLIEQLKKIVILYPVR